MDVWQQQLRDALTQRPWGNAPGAMLLAETEVHPVVVLQCLLAATGQVVVVTDTLTRAEALAAEVGTLQKLVGDPTPVHFLPELETVRHHFMPENESIRSRVIHQSGEALGAFVTSVTAVLAPTPAPARFRQQRAALRVGAEDWPLDRLVAFLVALDYDSEAEVHVPGEFARRGGILDVFSPVHDYPVRIEYSGDEVASLRLFDPETQRTLRPVTDALVIPRGEAVLVDPAETACCFLDYFAADALTLILCSPERIEEHLAEYATPASRDLWRRHTLGPTSHRFVVREDDGDPPPPGAPIYPVPCFALLPRFKTMVPEIEESWDLLHRQFLRTQLGRWQADGYRMVACCGSDSRITAIQSQLAEDEILAKLALTYCLAPLDGGLMFPEARLILLSEAELYGKALVRAAPRRESSFHADHLLTTGYELNTGDFVVHASYGIGRYLGLKREEHQGQTREVLVLEFADEVKVFVPVEQACLVSRYVGATRHYPKLSKVGSARWRAARQAAEVVVTDLAAELLRIQALREANAGYAFTTEGAAFALFERAFPYSETADQTQAIHEVIAEMAEPRPMDRLVCGDVGFGKTEVAMRAAFRAVLAGKQVAVLVPTTVLCQQHHYTFRERFKEYPVLIESISRFRTGHEQHELLEHLREGKIDIIIGTHRLLSADVRFKDLGLMIIDEEQRFGVLHKEKLKQLRANVDVLTMTATPIPRTLYLSLAGVRNISTIMTAPLERLPISTVVAPFDRDLIREVIRRELQRDGQVFYLHNRVKTIANRCDLLRRLVPEARFDVGHGQMPEHELEATMIRFLEGKTDVLVCTTIIESGLDIPNANTIIIESADKFGLAQLYQLRGRVGRYHRQAYAYLLLPHQGALKGQARDRLAAIRRFTQLGVGFKLALRDLEIRGCGNILGKEQSGQISAIGFNLYCKLLSTAVARLKHQPAATAPEPVLQLDFLVFGQSPAPGLIQAGIPTEYVAEDELRVDCHRRLGLLHAAGDVTTFAAELTDRFGAFPPAVTHLLDYYRLKLLAAQAEIISLTVRERKVLIETRRGLLKSDGLHFPRLQSPGPEDFLRELCALIERLPGHSPSSGVRGRAATSR